jgi:hypothetical protein
MVTADGARAQAAYAALERYFGVGHGLYHETHPLARDSRYAHAWPHTQALAATLDLFGIGAVHVKALRRCLRGLDWYWDGRPAIGLRGYESSVRWPLGHGGDKYHDDNAWAGLNLVRAHRMTGDAPALERARQVFALLVAGWEDTPSGVAPAGGVYWKQQKPGEANHDRNTVSTAPSAELGLRLYALTRDATDLEWARRMCDWVEAHLRAPDDLLYWDHLTRDDAGTETVERTKWSYNQGTMLGAYVLLAQATGDPAGAYSRRAAAVAQASLRHFDGRQATQGAAFNAIWFRNLLLLHVNARHDPALQSAIEQALRAYADWAWDSVRDPATDLFNGKGGDAPATVIDQAAMVQVFACLAWPPDAYDRLV